MGRVRAVLLVIDGVLTVSWQPVPGAVAAIEWLRAAAMPLALVTNTTSRSRLSMADALSAAGFPVTADDIVTAPAVAAAYLHDHYPGARCLLLNSGDIGADLSGITLAEPNAGGVDVVVIGGAGPEFSYRAINRAFRCLQDGARLVAMSRALYWRTSDGLQLDSGAFVAGLELAGHTTRRWSASPPPRSSSSRSVGWACPPRTRSWSGTTSTTTSSRRSAAA